MNSDIEALRKIIDAEDKIRKEAPGPDPEYSRYSDGPVMGAHDRHEYSYAGFNSAIYHAREGSERDLMIHVVARRASEDSDVIVCAFESGVLIDIERARQVAANGYAKPDHPVTEVRHDREVRARFSSPDQVKNANDAFTFILKHQGQSVYHAVRFEGWSIVDISPDGSEKAHTVR